MKSRAVRLMLLGGVLVSCCAVLGLCAYRQGSVGPSITVGKAVLLTRGIGPNGQRWELLAQVERNGYLHRHQQRLCLDLMVAGRQTAGMCEFDDSSPEGFWNYGQGPGGSSFVLGPVPPAAMSVRLSYPGVSTRTVPTAPLPRLPGIPAGRYFIADVDPTGRLTARSVTALSQGGRWWTVTPLDSSGHPVAFTPF